MVYDWHLTEWVPGQMFRRAERLRRYGSETVLCAFFFQRDEDCSTKRATGYAVDHEVVHAGVPFAASLTKSSSNIGQPLLTSPLIFSPAAGPMRSKFRCSSSTRVRPAVSGMNRTSTSEVNEGRGSGFHSALISHVTTKRSPGSQTST